MSTSEDPRGPVGLAIVALVILAAILALLPAVRSTSAVEIRDPASVAAGAAGWTHAVVGQDVYQPIFRT